MEENKPWRPRTAAWQCRVRERMLHWAVVHNTQHACMCLDAFVHEPWGLIVCGAFCGHMSSRLLTVSGLFPTEVCFWCLKVTLPCPWSIFCQRSSQRFLNVSVLSTHQCFCLACMHFCHLVQLLTPGVMLRCLGCRIWWFAYSLLVYFSLGAVMRDSASRDMVVRTSMILYFAITASVFSTVHVNNTTAVTVSLSLSGSSDGITPQGCC